MNDWPLFDLRLTGRGVTLRPVREDDLPHLAAILPGDVGYDPRLELFPAFDHLGADVAITSAVTTNRASLGVSRRVGYTDNGVGLVRETTGVAPLQNLRLTAGNWRHGSEVIVTGFDACRPWFGL